MSGLPEHESEMALEEIRSYREAARRIREHPTLSEKQRLVGLVRLAERARSEAELPTFCQQAIWLETSAMFWQPPKPRFPGDLMEQACRLLVSAGYIRCPRCRQSLPQAIEFERWAGLRQQYVAELQARPGGG